MSSKTTSKDTKKANEDQYDALLQAAQPGLILSVNNQQPGESGTGELTVTYSDDANTDVHVEGFDGQEYRIHRNARGELVFAQCTDTNSQSERKVTTIEILGLQ